LHCCTNIILCGNKSFINTRPPAAKYLLPFHHRVFVLDSYPGPVLATSAFSTVNLRCCCCCKPTTRCNTFCKLCDMWHPSTTVMCFPAWTSFYCYLQYLEHLHAVSICSECSRRNFLSSYLTIQLSHYSSQRQPGILSYEFV